MVRARRKPCLNDTHRSIIDHLGHVRCIKACTQIGTVLRFRLGGASAMKAKHASRKWPKNRIRCKTRCTAKFGHPIVAGFDAYDERATIPQDKTARSGQPKPYPHWYFLAFCGDRPDTDDVIEGANRRRQVPHQLSQNRIGRPDLVPPRCQHHTTLII